MTTHHDSTGFEANTGEDSHVMCSIDSSTRANAFCAWCRKPFSSPFLVTSHDGRAACYRCVKQYDIKKLHDQPLQRDPALNHPVHRILYRILLQPHKVFARPWNGSIWPAIQFGILASVLGLIFWNAWFWLLSEDLAQKMIAMVTERTGQPISRTEVQRMSWFIIPILALIRFGLGTIGLHVGLRLAGAPRNTWRHHVRVFALASTALLLCIVPSAVGSFLAHIAWLTTCLAFAVTRYDFSVTRALFALMPSILLVAIFPPH